MVVATSTGYRERNSTADRALTILDLFSDERLTVSATQVVAALECSRSTAYRYLQTLVSTSFLEEAPGGGFRLGVRVMELSRLARRGYGLTEIALPVMRELAARVHETVLLTRLVDEAVVCVERCEGSRQLVRISYERGSRLPTNAGASALVLMAWLPEAEARELLSRAPQQRFTKATVTEVDALLARLAEIRRRGVAVSIGEVDPDAAGIAAPIFTETGSVQAGLSVVVMRRDLPRVRLRSLIGDVQHAAEQLTGQLATISA